MPNKFWKQKVGYFLGLEFSAGICYEDVNRWASFISSLVAIFLGF